MRNIIVGAFKCGRYDTPLYQELAKVLDVSEDGPCLLDITSILDSFQRKSKLQNLSAEQTTKTLVDSLNIVGLNIIASQICKIQDNVQGGKANNTESRIRLYDDEEVNADLSRCQCLTSRSFKLKHSRGKSLEWILLAILCLLPSAALLIYYNLPTKEPPVLKHIVGAVGFKGKELNWIRDCHDSMNYTNSLDPMSKQISLYGATQVGDEIWQCGGTTPDRDIEQSKTCQVLSLVSGNWRVMEVKLNLPRLQPFMYKSDRKVFVMGGKTSDVNIESGCRNTMEVGMSNKLLDFIINSTMQVYNLDNPGQGWQLEDIEETLSCHSRTSIINIECD